MTAMPMLLPQGAATGFGAGANFLPQAMAPQTPEEIPGFFQKMQQTPGAVDALIALGAGLMQPVQPNDSRGGVIGKALAGSHQALRQGQSREAQQKLLERREGREDKKVDASIEQGDRGLDIQDKRTNEDIRSNQENEDIKWYLAKLEAKKSSPEYLRTVNIISGEGKSAEFDQKVSRYADLLQKNFPDQFGGENGKEAALQTALERIGGLVDPNAPANARLALTRSIARDAMMFGSQDMDLNEFLSGLMDLVGDEPAMATQPTSPPAPPPADANPGGGLVVPVTPDGGIDATRIVPEATYMIQGQPRKGSEILARLQERNQEGR